MGCKNSNAWPGTAPFCTAPECNGCIYFKEDSQYEMDDEDNIRLIKEALKDYEDGAIAEAYDKLEIVMARIREFNDRMDEQEDT